MLRTMRKATVQSSAARARIRRMGWGSRFGRESTSLFATSLGVDIGSIVPSVELVQRYATRRRQIMLC